MDSTTKLNLDLEPKGVYGKTIYKPLCTRSEILTNRLLDQKTLTEDNIHTLKKLGFTIRLYYKGNLMQWNNNNT